MKKFNALVSERLLFTPISLKDAEAIHTFASDEDVSRFIGWPLTETLEETEDYVKEMIEREDKGSHLYASLVEKNTKRVIGCVMLFNFDKSANSGEVGYVLHKAFWGKGYISEALRVMVAYAFDIMDLHRLSARVVDTNYASAKVLEKNGFKKEGHFRDNYFIEGRYYDGMYYGLIHE